MVDLKAVAADIDGAYVNVQRAKEELFNATNLTFPLKQAYDDSRRTIFGLQRGHQATIMDLFETDSERKAHIWDVPPVDPESGGKPPRDSSRSPSSSSDGEKCFPPMSGDLTGEKQDE
ncbi:MAG: hypothetical protein GY780_08115, partial [bacterium]|nr:hypothetical protein [bacterium]